MARNSEFQLPTEGWQAEARFNNVNVGAAAAVIAQPQDARARSNRGEDARETACRTRGGYLHERQIPDSIPRRAGNRLQHGFHNNHHVQSQKPALTRLATTPVVITSRLQLIESVFAERVRAASRATLDRIARECPHLDSTAAHCFHAMFDETVIGAFTRALNQNLRLGGQQPVTHDEFVRWVATFLLRCLLPCGHTGVVGHVRGTNLMVEKNIVHEDRFQRIKSAFTLLPGSTSCEDKVCRTGAAYAWFCSFRVMTVLLLLPGRCQCDRRHRESG